MENATKALLIAGGMLLTIMIITVFMIGWDSISNYFKAQTQNTREIQLAEFNQQFENYANNDIRGNDMLSLISKVNDYNTRQTEVAGLGYAKMKINIEIKDPGEFCFDKKDEKIIKSKITQENIDEILTSMSDIESKYGSVDEASKLSSNIHNFVGKDITKDEATKYLSDLLIKNVNELGGLEQIQKDARNYYQISQFKKAHFNCNSTQYDDNRKNNTYEFYI